MSLRLLRILTLQSSDIHLTMIPLAQTATDTETLSAILTAYLESVSDADWQHRTGTRDKDWTRHQTLAHLVSIAKLFNHGIDAALKGHRLTIPGLTRREDLPAFNAAQIETLSAFPPDDLLRQLQAQLARSAQTARDIAPEQAQLAADVLVYNRPVPVGDLLDFQLSHVGVVHAAQIADGAPPLWKRYPADLLHRQTDRFVRHFSVAYWQDYAPNLQTAINFHIEGEAGGDWHLIADPSGGRAGQGSAADAGYALRVADAGVFFGIFTAQVDVTAALQSGELTISGDPMRTMQLLRLFAATPPHQPFA